MSSSSRIKVLSPEVARKIAAGEVIDRPNAIVRELMDNAADSGADSVTVEITGGGIDKIRVIDNGSGLTKEDLEIAATPHATSKIVTETDLLSLTTMGFRGEALSSIAAVSNLTITSGEYKLTANVSDGHNIIPNQSTKGAIVQSENLFFNFPARRLFLKRPATETKMCQQTFIEKVLPFNNIAFRLYIDGVLKYDLPKEDSILKRFVKAIDLKGQKDLFYAVTNKAADSSWNYTLILCDPGVYRTDRKDIYVYVNNRRVTEYSLMQAIEYGCTGYFPNGTHPVAAVFVNIDSSLVDFNIHPAKKEVRFKDSSELHHSISSTTRDFYKNFTLRDLSLLQNKNQEEQTSAAYTSSFFEPETSGDYTKSHSTYQTHYFKNSTKDYFESRNSTSDIKQASKPADFRSQLLDSGSTYAAILANQASQENQEEKPYVADSKTENADNDGVKYFGTTQGVFLLAEKDNILYLIDQHAAHERILFDKIMDNPGKAQNLLVPYTINISDESDDSYLESIKEELEQLCFKIHKDESGSWILTSVHYRWNSSEEEFVKMLLDERVPPEKILYHIAASTACKAAIKDGYYLDEITASELAAKALRLPDPHCPHGRPVFTAFTKDDLFALVRRTQ